MSLRSCLRWGGLTGRRPLGLANPAGSFRNNFSPVSEARRGGPNTWEKGSCFVAFSNRKTAHTFAENALAGQGCQPGIGAIGLSGQKCMRALFNNAALIKHQNAVGIADG